MKIRNRIAPLALATALAFGVAACETDDTVGNEVEDVEDGAEEGAEEMEEGAEDMEEGAEDMEEDAEG